jgi:rhodanese-related sulfurtransferase
VALKAIKLGIEPQNAYALLGGLNAWTGAGYSVAGAVQRIGAQGAKALLDAGAALLYHVGSAELYSAGHAAGAISFPEDELDVLFDTLPADKGLIFYCI